MTSNFEIYNATIKSEFQGIFFSLSLRWEFDICWLSLRNKRHHYSHREGLINVMAYGNDLILISCKEKLVSTREKWVGKTGKGLSNVYRRMLFPVYDYSTIILLIWALRENKKVNAWRVNPREIVWVWNYGEFKTGNFKLTGFNCSCQKTDYTLSVLHIHRNNCDVIF